MNSPFAKQSQFELFPQAADRNTETPKPRWSFSNLSLSFDHIVIMCVVIIIGMVVSFSLGIERGQRIVKQSSAQDRPEAVSTSREASRPKVVTPAVKPSKSINDSSSMASDSTKVGSETQSAAGSSAESPVQNELDTAPESPDKKRVDNLYTIQVASFQKETAAQQEAEALEKNGYEILVMPKGKHSIVCVGQFNQRQEATQFSQQLRKRYKDLLVRRL